MVFNESSEIRRRYVRTAGKLLGRKDLQNYLQKNGDWSIYGYSCLSAYLQANQEHLAQI